MTDRSHMLHAGVRRAKDLAWRLAEPIAERVDRHNNVYTPYRLQLDCPTSSQNHPRYGYGKAVHRRIEGVLARHDDRYQAELERLVAFTEDLSRIPVDETDGREPCWDNAYLPGFDTVALYGFLRSREPRRYVEVGSGYSTRVVHRARSDGGLATAITSIDPNPRRQIDELCDEVIRQPLEQLDPSVLTSLQADDMLFVDASHRVFQNSDMVAFYLDILPELPDGLLVGVHDILWPDDYLPEWSEYWFSEQYLLAAYLIADTPWLVPVLASNYALGQPDLAAVAAPLWARPEMAGVDKRGFGFWFTIDRGRVR